MFLSSLVRSVLTKIHICYQIFYGKIFVWFWKLGMDDVWFWSSRGVKGGLGGGGGGAKWTSLCNSKK